MLGSDPGAIWVDADISFKGKNFKNVASLVVNNTWIYMSYLDIQVLMILTWWICLVLAKVEMLGRQNEQYSSYVRLAHNYSLTSLLHGLAISSKYFNRLKNPLMLFAHTTLEASVLLCLPCHRTDTIQTIHIMSGEKYNLEPRILLMMIK